MKASTKKVSPTSKTRWNYSHVDMLYNVVAMALSVTYLTVTQSITALYNLILGIQSNLSTIETLRIISASPITGYAAQKKALRVGLEALSVTIMNAAYSMAIATNNEVLAAQCLNAPKQFRKGYRPFLDTVRSAIANVTPYVTDASLTPYGITSGMISTWGSLADQLEDVMSNPQNAIGIRVATNNNIQSLLLDCMVILTNSGDTMVTQLKDSNADYYNAYWSGRRLHQHHVFTKLRVYATYAGGGPVTQGQVFLIGTDISGDLDMNGFCMIENIPHGVYTFAVATIYSTPTFGPFEIKQGHSLTKHVVVPGPEAASKTPGAPVQAPKEETSLKNSNTNLN